MSELFHYPIKGLSPQQDTFLAVTAENGLVGPDRRFALALGTTEFDADHPEPLDKGYFLMLRRNESLAALKTVFDGDTGALTIVKPDGATFAANLEEPAGRVAVEDFFADYLGDACKGRPKLVEAAGHKFTDVSVVSPAMMRAVSVINLASVRDLEARFGRPVHPLRFRANIYLDGLAPWEELTWVGRDVTIGSARFRCVLRTKRCAAIDVDPETGLRDTALPKAIFANYGHPDCGVYFEVSGDGTIEVGDDVICDEAA
ncbi:MOSC domain-containing protein [Beijerinckia sp. L45]|uniref:MOSC domain-containing protein n=1 Tax=Beijerinckia sp. L45 TaxID=1641855 RepID=UPI001FEE15F7|nr:MOSC domain-containing protein [Beijerinckia sp. L45]